MLHTFNLQQQVTIFTTKRKSLIDHLCRNIPNKLVHANVILIDEIRDYDTP